jgi:hypothetical protein
MKGKGKGKKSNNVDDIMNNINLAGYGDDAMDDGMANFEKNFNPEQQFNIPIYDNIDKEFDKFSKMFGGGEEPDLSSAKKNPKEISEEDKILKAILGEDINKGAKKKKNNDMDELTKALKMAEDNLNKKHGKNNDADLLKGIFAETGNKKKKDDMDDLTNILSAADRNLKNKNKDDMELVKKFLTKEELNEASGEGGGAGKKTQNVKNPVKKPETKPQNVDEDLYPLQQEKIFHRINQMKSLTVLEKEIKLCNYIIEYKKKKQANYKEWEDKINEANIKLNEIKSKVESGEMDYEEYKKTISIELAYEEKLLNDYVPKDKASTPAQLEQIKKRINDRIVIINKEINNEVDDEEDENNQDKEAKKEKEISPSENKAQESTPSVQSNDDKTKLYVDLLLQQYLSARDYFKENNFKDQEKDCIEKCKLIIIAKKKIQDGKINEVNLNELPKSIKPEYIYGCTSEERTAKFKEILSELIKQKGEIESKKKEYEEKLRKLNKKDFAKVKDQAKGVLDSYQTKINKYLETIESIKENFKDKWTPAPEFCKNEEEVNVEKINNDIPEYTMRIHIGKTDYDKDNVYLKVKLMNGEKELTKEVQLKGNKDFNETWDWKFEKNEYKRLYKKDLEIELERSYWYKFGGSNVKGSLKIKLDSLEKSNQLVGDYKMELVSKRTNPSINVSINLRTPFSGKQFETVTKEVFSVKKVFPPFNPKSAKIPGSGPAKTSSVKKPAENINKKEDIRSESNPKSVESKPQVTERKSTIKEKTHEEISKKPEVPEKKHEVPEKKPEVPEKKPEAHEKKPEASVPQKIDKSMFKEEELADIDNIDYLNSLKVLKYKLKQLEEQIAKISGRTPRELLQKKVKISCKIKLMEQQMGEGDVSPQDYYNLLDQQLIHDKALFAFFKQEKDLEKAKLVAMRVKLLNEEMEELKQYIQ